MRITPLLFVILIAPSLHAKNNHNNWAAVKQLPVGQPVEVLERGGYPTTCRIETTDDATLACIVTSLYAPPQRAIFPLTDIAGIYALEPSKGPSHVGVLISTAICAGLGGVAGSHYGAGPAFIGVALGALIGANIALDQPQGRYPVPMRRRLIYRAP